jgi:hypothetical protein
MRAIGKTEEGMNKSRAKTFRRYVPWQFILSLVLVAAIGCSIRLIAEYDKKIDDGVTELQKKTEAFLIKMERIAETPEGAYAKHIGFYDEVKVDLSLLKVRADAIALNDLTSKQIGLLQDSFKSLEEQHKKGLKAVMIESIRQSLNTQFTSILKLEVSKERRK